MRLTSLDRYLKMYACMSNHGWHVAMGDWYESSGMYIPWQVVRLNTIRKQRNRDIERC